MTTAELKAKIKTRIFPDFQVGKAFPNEKKTQINTQLSRMALRGDIIRIKRGLFTFGDLNELDAFTMANRLYSPSYVSLESALHSYGIIPDVLQSVTSVSPVTSKKIKTKMGTFLYSKINKDLYFGFTTIGDMSSDLISSIAFEEKALLDYIYVRKIKSLKSLRIDQSLLNSTLVKEFGGYFPKWVRDVIYE